jgi:hypothetical protein
MNPGLLIFVASWLGFVAARIILPTAPTTMAIASIAMLFSVLVLILAAVARADDEPGRVARVLEAICATTALASFGAGLLMLIIGLGMIA